MSLGHTRPSPWQRRVIAGIQSGRIWFMICRLVMYPQIPARLNPMYPHSQDCAYGDEIIGMAPCNFALGCCMGRQPRLKQGRGQLADAS